jgi:hypothetical protein
VWCPRETFKSGEAFARESCYAPQLGNHFDKGFSPYRAEP